MKLRYAVYWLSQDAEPELVGRPVAYFAQLADARAFAAEYASDTSGGYVALQDCYLGDWITL